MLAFVLAAALTATATAPACLPADPADVVVEQRTLALEPSPPLYAYAVSRRGENGPLGYDSSRVVIYGADCQVRYQQVFDAVETHFALATLGEQPLLVVTSMSPGGSGAGFEQVVLGYDSDGVFALAPQRLQYSNMDGFHLGDLGDGRGEGLVLWTAIWDEAHYDPHRYRVTTYHWQDGRFTGPEMYTTAKRYDPDPEAVAKALGLPTDQTGAQRFKLIDAE